MLAENKRTIEGENAEKNPANWRPLNISKCADHIKFFLMNEVILYDDLHHHCLGVAFNNPGGYGNFSEVH